MILKIRKVITYPLIMLSTNKTKYIVNDVIEIKAMNFVKY